MSLRTFLTILGANCDHTQLGVLADVLALSGCAGRAALPGMRSVWLKQNSFARLDSGGSSSAAATCNFLTSRPAQLAT